MGDGGAGVRDVERDTLQFLAAGDQLLDWVQRATRVVYHGLIICNSVLNLKDRSAEAFLTDCSARKLHVVCFDAEAAAPRQLQPGIYVLPIAPDAVTLSRHLETQGLHLKRMARVVSEHGRQLVLLTHPDIETVDKTRPGPAFIATKQVPPSGRRIPALSSTRGFQWGTDDNQDVRRVLIPIVKGPVNLWGLKALRFLISRLHFVPRITIGAHAQSLRDGTILDALIPVRKQAAKNVRVALSLAEGVDPKAPSMRDNVFDHKSGAVYLEPSAWRRLEANHSSTIAALLIPYFSERLSHAWSPAHPCYRRVLFTPTKVLLRGEAYYINMRQESPFQRFRLILDEMDRLATVACGIMPHLGEAQEDEWKLVLALLDQIRNIALQAFSFLHAAPSVLGVESSGQGDWPLKSAQGDGARGAHGFLQHSIRAYYSWLLHRDSTSDLTEAVRCFIGARTSIREVVDRAEKVAAEKGISQDAKLAGLVRGWREADHPGENLLTSILAANRLHREKRLGVVGIGWGGIELPLVFDFASSLLLPEQQERRLYIARYSHYRAASTKPVWEAFPNEESETPQIEGLPIALLDDNTLTGLTLEEIRDDLLLHGSDSVHMFVTRYSGERRHAHMQMEDHGVIDPEFLLNDVGGYLGETPFARSWSKKKKDYKNHVGVFSLARRRILECIYNNSTVALYNREGF